MIHRPGIRGLTLTQPWASLVANGAKRYETRSWSTSYRGPLAIHAAKGLGSVGGKDGLWRLCGQPPFSAGFAGLDARRLPLGMIVATCVLADIYPTSAAFVHDLRCGEAGGAEHELAFGDYSPGRYAWALSDVRALAEPVLCRGALSLWPVPHEIVPLLER